MTFPGSELLRTVFDTLALIQLGALPGAILFWFLIHPLAGVWRRLGPRLAYPLVAAVCLAAMFAIWSQRGTLMAVHWGYRPATVILGGGIWLAGVVWDRRVLDKLDFKTLAGLPEISLARPSRLVTDGPYARVRHPRYLGALLSACGFAIVVNYPALYAVTALAVPAGWLMIALEERELRRRFGAAYEAYAARVPRFWPRRRSAGVS